MPARYRMLLHGKREDPAPDYGTTRERRASVSYAEFERAATTLMKSGAKPGLENLRKALGGGSPETIRQMLRRYWTEVAARLLGPAEALMRLPPEVADLADELWQRSLALAATSAAHDDNAARERLEQIKRENEVRSHALAVRERTLREQEERREQVMQELQQQVATLLSIVSQNAETIAALQVAKTAGDAAIEDYRRRFTNVIARTVTRNRKATVQTFKPGPTNRKRRKLKAEKPQLKPARRKTVKKRVNR